MILGAFQFVIGMTALFNDEWFLVSNSGLTLHLDYSTWGWIYLGLGLLIAVAGAMVLVGSWFGRIVGILVAGFSAVSNLVSIAAYPLWSMVIITVDILVIYTLAVHGGELRDPTEEIPLDVTNAG